MSKPPPASAREKRANFRKLLQASTKGIRGARPRLNEERQPRVSIGRRSYPSITSTLKCLCPQPVQCSSDLPLSHRGSNTRCNGPTLVATDGRKRGYRVVSLFIDVTKNNEYRQRLAATKSGTQDWVGRDTPLPPTSPWPQIWSTC